ncbi:dTDP-4-dehydrorhamnose 3,5-epimerase [Marinilabiliaceae bacterium ANBcel2]|nr:dTDP-4-dehydrorhamnose 3,5-epimerase [Marinilabiliaceae bacterium ANBcel2]
MKIKTTEIPDLLIIEPQLFGDNRGCFFESYNEKRFKEHGITTNFVQDNVSHSIKNTIRGLHYQLAPHSQAKLIQILKGKVLDIAVDIRENSPTYGKYFAVELSDKNNLQFYIPEGFAHGFSVLSDQAIFLYKCSKFYNRESERGIIFNDFDLNIDWQISPQKAIISDKDAQLPPFKEAEHNFYF